MYNVIDAHCDTASELLDKSENLVNNNCMIKKEFMEHYDSYIQVFAAYVNKKYKNPLERALCILNKAKNEIKRNDLELILSCDDLKRTIKQKKCGAILSIEDARALCGKLLLLYFFYDYGVRAITLAWNDDNEVTDGANSNKQSGLTDFGRDVIREMNRLKMMIDVSHISEKGFWDVMSETRTPVIASHSNCYNQCHHRRNLKNEQIKALIDTGGMMCINIYPPFLEKESEKASIKSVIRHIDYALSLGAENNLGLGSDFDGIDMTPVDFHSLLDYEKLFNEMKKMNYTQELIDKITHINFINFMERVEK